MIETFSTGKIKVTRSIGSGQYVGGKYLPPKTRTLFIDSSTQPLSPKEIQVLDTRRQETENLKFFTNLELLINDQIKKTQADLVEYKGRLFEIHKVTDWSDSPCLPHFESVGMLVDPQGNK